MFHNYLTKLVATLSVIIFSVAVNAQNFWKDKLYYRVLSSTEKTLEVTYTGNSSSSDPARYTGDIVIPSGFYHNGDFYKVVSIGAEAFQKCNKLTSITIGNNVSKICESAFGSCYKLTKIVIPNNVTHIEHGAFEGCGLTEVYIEDGTTDLGMEFCECYDDENYGLFSHCDQINAVYLGRNIKPIYSDKGDWKVPFYDVTSLTSIEIGAHVSNIQSNLFSDCPNITSIKINSNNTTYDSRENCNAIVETATNKLIVGCQNTVIPNSITSIGGGAFYDCYNLTNITIPNSVAEIGNAAFYGSGWYEAQPDGLLYLDGWLLGYKGWGELVGDLLVAEGTKGIADEALYSVYYNIRITGVKIPEGVTRIGEMAFYDCGALNKVELPSTITSIGRFAFGDTSLETIISSIPAENLFAIPSNVFSNKNTCVLYVPRGTVDTYRATAGWSELKNIEEIPFDLTISSAGYATLYLDYAVTIPEGVEVYVAKSIEGDLLKMEAVTDVIPSKTGVIVKAPAGTYKFSPSTDAPLITENLFKGSFVDEYVNVPSGKVAYVLSIVDGEVGMYRAELIDGSFLNNANKAYLMLGTKDLGIFEDQEIDSTIGQLSNGFHFFFPEVTHVEGVQIAVPQKNFYYDLQGRKVKNLTRGMYIYNGKKVYVK